MSEMQSEEIEKGAEVAVEAAPAAKKRAPRSKRAAGKPVDPNRTPQDGDTVTVEYIGTLPGGKVFDKATTEEPFVFTVGAGQVLPKFEAIVKSMRIGEPRTISLHFMEAYGPYRDKMIITVPRESFPAADRLEVGKRATVADSKGNQEVMKVVEITGSTVRLDGNHPLAGQTLVFHDVRITAIS